MQRTTLMLPEELKARATRHAQATDKSLGQFIREAMEIYLRQSQQYVPDTLLDDDGVCEDDVPYDLSTHHDDHLLP